MDEDAVDFYSPERWENWLARLDQANLDDEEETSRLYLNLQNDAAIAVGKVINAYEDDVLSTEDAVGELAEIQEVVLAEPPSTDEEAELLIDAVQTSLVSVFMAADSYLNEEPIDVGDVTGNVEAAVEAEADERFNEALSHVAEVGLSIIDGNDFDMSAIEDIEYGLVTEWLGGLDSLQEALRGPKVIEE